jgi:NAD+ synthase
VSRDIATLAKAITRILRETVRQSGYRRGVVGLTGRVDEAVVGALAAEALGAAQTRLVVLVDPDAEDGSDERARAAGKHLAAPIEIVALDPHLDALLDAAPEADPGRRRGFLARLRTALLHDRASAHRALVLGAASKTDRMLGRDSLFGESACAVNPIGDVYATDVRALAAHLGIPDEIVGPEPVVDVPESSVQGGSFEPTYAWIDPLLRHIVDGRLRRRQLMALGYERPDIKRMVMALRASEYKRKPPTVPKLS